MRNKKIILIIIFIFLTGWGLSGNFLSAKALTLDNIDSGIDFISSLSKTVSDSMPEIDTKRFLGVLGLSGSDLLGAIKALAILVIKIFFTVISVVYQIIMVAVNLLSNWHIL